ncbi:SoxR reducing system RseC family protein [Lawsonibacter hominis]|uniref:SoxR reducing system RseC family protein n=1 Tax=Lawsonibacter hominis TaxID=2763053 RepID=UPI001FAC67DF|nr:SoxR reducing system RseC family protein [Lawsonibacter hominis]
MLEDGRAEVAVKRQSACGHDCSKCGGGCSELMVSSTVAVVAENPVRAMPGDRVTVESSTGGVLKAAALVYLAPFVLFFLGYFLTAALGMTEGVSAACGGIGFAAGVVLAIFLDRHVRKSRGISFRITGIEPAA